MTTAALAPGAAAARDYASTARNIIPSGQYGSVPPPEGADTQAKMYDALTPLFDRVKFGDIIANFKSEALAPEGQVRDEPVPNRPGLKIVRDGYNVPHITGETNDDVTLGAGWVTAQDRELLLEQARFISRVAAIDAPGLDAVGLISDLGNFKPSAQTENEVAKQTAALEHRKRKGRAVLHDIDMYVEGINAYYRSKSKTYKPWTRNDIYAVNALKGQFVGQGGGREPQASMFLNGLRAHLGRNKGNSVFNDLRQRRVLDTPVSVDGRFPYAPVPKRGRGNVILDNGSFRSSSAAATSRDRPRREASNILMVSPKRSKSGLPLMVGGPQIGYFYPGFTGEMNLKGPGWEARGATSAPFPGYILIGRREDFAYSLSSAGEDIIDHYVETLCDGSDTKYVYKGRCRDMEPFDAGELSVDGETKQVKFNRTVHGPVVGYARVGGRKVAVSRKRASYGRDTVDQLLYRDLTRGRIRSPRDLYRAASQTPQTFNTFYVDHRNVAMYTSGFLPIRPRSIDSGLPVDGRGGYEWDGWLPASKHPHGSNPRSGLLNNWNNKPAAGFPGADDQFNYGTIHRVDLLNRGLSHRRKHTLASVTSAMNAAATQDVRSVGLLPVLARALRTGPAPSPRARQMLEIMEDWRNKGSSRLDGRLDGQIDHPGAAIWDRAWPKMADATLKPLLGTGLAEQLNDTLMSRFNLPPGGQSSGWHMYLHRDLRKLLRLRIRDPFRNRYCGRGNLARCRASLWSALERAGDELAAELGPNPDAWRSDATRERIKFTPGLLTTTMRYTNRPTGIQQVIAFDGHR